DAADLHALPRDDVGGVVEDRAHAVAAVGAARGGREQQDHGESACREQNRDAPCASPPPQGLPPQPFPPTGQPTRSAASSGGPATWRDRPTRLAAAELMPPRARA